MDFDTLYPILYKGWDQTAARADFAAGGYKNKAEYRQLISGGASGGDNVNAAIENAFQKLNEEVATRFRDYRANNPFRIDEILAQKGALAKEQIDPYYNETLNDYITGVQRKIQRGTQDTKDLLSELQADTSSYTRDVKMSLDQALNKASEGFAGAGLFSSGERLRTQGEATVGAANQLGDFNRKQAFRENSINTGLNRQVEDLGIAKTQNVRDIERQRTTDIETRKSQLAKESGQQFVTGFRATLPPQLQAASGFDLLQDLGIYS